MSLTFGALLRLYRERAGISQRRLSLDAKLDHSTIARFEGEERFPAADTVVKIADTLDLDVADTAALLVAAGFWPGSTGAVLVLDALHAARSAGVDGKWRM